MLTIGFVALERFDPSVGEAWTKYISWSGHDHLAEVVSLDCSLCPSVLDTLPEGGWERVIYADIFFGIHSSLDELLARAPESPNIQILAVSREPSREDIGRFQDESFSFLGYDLLEEETQISTLTNCTNFPKAFSSGDLSCSGLVTARDRAFQIRSSLLQHYPEESHADCTVWAVWRRAV